MKVLLFVALLGAQLLAYGLPRTQREQAPETPKKVGKQDKEPDLERFLRLARSGPAAIRPQAAKRFLDLGETRSTAPS